MDIIGLGLTTFVSFGTSYLTSGNAITKWLDALFYLKIGHKTMEEAENLKHQYELQRTQPEKAVTSDSLDAVREQLIQVKNDQSSFQESVVRQLAQISESNQKIPNRNIAAPIMEATESYIHDPEVREMFAKLLASSADKSKENVVRPAFVQIVKELSPIDARILNALEDRSAIGELRRIYDKGSVTLITNIIASTDSFGAQKMVSSSLSNLQRLGLIEISYDKNLVAEHAYDHVESVIGFENIKKTHPDEKYEVHQGLLAITPIGKDFRSVALR